MMQNSLDRLFAGMVAALRDVILPTIDDAYARSQLAACIELLNNMATRVEWSPSQLATVAGRARDATESAIALCAGLGDALGAEAPADDPLVARDHALERVSRALRWCDEHEADEAVRAPLTDFARWHLQHELSLLRTGMFGG